MAEKLKIKANKITGSKACTPKSTNIKNTPLVIYVDKEYMTINYGRVIRYHCGSTEDIPFLQKKYGWIKITLDNIEWELQENDVERHTYLRKKTVLKLIHR